MRESDVKADIVARIKHEGGYGRRIEDKFAVGVPDTVLIPKLCPVIWVEVKVMRDVNMLRPTPRQLIELIRLHRPPHSISFMIGWKDGVLYITPPSEGTHIQHCIKQLPTETVGDLIRRALKEEAAHAQA